MGKPRDGLLEKAIEDATSIPDVHVQEDDFGNVRLTMKRTDLDNFLARCGKIDDFLKDLEQFYDVIPDHMGRW